MRAVVSRVSLDDAIGAGRSQIEQNVEQNMQQLLDAYGAGIRIQGVAINQSAPPGRSTRPSSKSRRRSSAPRAR